MYGQQYQEYAYWCVSVKSVYMSEKTNKNLSLQNYYIYYIATAGAGCETSISIMLNYHFANKLLLIVCRVVLFLSWICEWYDHHKILPMSLIVDKFGSYFPDGKFDNCFNLLGLNYCY